MGYQPKIIRGRVKDTGYPIDGLGLYFSLWDYDNYESYHLVGWNKEDDEAVADYAPERGRSWTLLI